MPVNSTEQSIPVKRDWAKSGNSYVGSNPLGDAPASGGNAALAWSAANGFVAGQSITVTTDGTYAFGATGPDVVLLMDAADYALGRADGTEIRQGSAAVLVEGGDFFVESDANLPAGKGWRMGSNGGSGTDGTSLWCDHTASTKFFETQTYYYSSENIENARTEAATDWQMKPVWHMSQRQSGGEDEGTNVLIFRPCVNSNAGVNRRANSYLATNNTFTNYFTNSEVNNPSDANKYPYPVPYTMEVLLDQGSADGVTLDGSLDYFVTASNGLINERATASGLRISANATVNKVLDSFKYPGFFRGMNYSLDAHLLDSEYYCAVGDGSACRVAITNNADYFAASKRTILWTTSWANGSITAELREGWFDLSNTSGLYINVIDASNTQVGSIAL